MRLMKIQPEKRLALFLLISVSLVWGQTGTSGRAADSSAPPTSFPAPTPAALATAEHAISGHDPGPSGTSPVTDLLKLLLANVNSTEAMTNMEAMWATDRYFDFARFQQTAKNVAEMMRQAGLDDVQIGQGPADGVTQNGFWTQPIAWDAHSATLEIVSPQVPEDMRVLADYQKIPTSLCQWSGPTPPGGVEGELVLRPNGHSQCGPERQVGAWPSHVQDRFEAGRCAGHGSRERGEPDAVGRARLGERFRR